MPKYKTILIIGSTGYIGSNFLNYIIKKNFKITTIAFKNNLKNKYNNINCIKCDITNLNLLKKKLNKKKFDYVMNFSGYVDHSSFSKNGMSIINNHLIGLINILSIIKIKNIKRLIHIGSSEEYGLNASPQNKDTLGKPYTPYSFSKISISLFLQMMHKNEGLNFSIARVFLVYGPGQKNNRVIPYIIDSAIKNKRINLTNGNQIRDFIYIEDLVEGLYKLLISKKANGLAVNLSSGNPVSIKQITKIIIKLLGKGNVEFGKNSLRKFENKSLYADISHNKKIFNWKSKTQLEKGLLKTINFFKDDKN